MALTQEFFLTCLRDLFANDCTIEEVQETLREITDTDTVGDPSIAGSDLVDFDGNPIPEGSQIITFVNPATGTTEIVCIPSKNAVVDTIVTVGEDGAIVGEVPDGVDVSNVGTFPGSWIIQTDGTACLLADRWPIKRLCGANNAFTSDDPVTIDSAPCQGVERTFYQNKDGSIDYEDVIQMQGARAAGGVANINLTAGDDVGANGPVRIVIGTANFFKPCTGRWRPRATGYYDVRGITGDDFVGQIQTLFEISGPAGTVATAPFVFNNSNGTPAPGTTGADPTDDEQRPSIDLGISGAIGGSVAPKGVYTLEFAIILDSQFNEISEGTFNVNQWIVDLPDIQICCETGVVV